MTDKPLVLVTGATGKQGGEVARALLKKGYRVRAMTRKTDSEAAQKLKELGAELFEATFDDMFTLEDAIEGAEILFAMSTPFETNPRQEIIQGNSLANLSRAAKVKHVVFTTVASANQNTGIPHFNSKYEIEKHLTFLDVPHTIIGPVCFMENLYFPQLLNGLKNGVLASPMPAERKLQYIATEDIGHFCAHVIDQREAFVKKRIDIASDELSGTEMAAILSEVTGRTITYQELPLDTIREQSEDMALMYSWFTEVGYQVDIQALKSSYPEIGWHSFKTWAKEQDWSVLNS